AELARRIADVQSASLPWLVAERGGDVVGYAYASKWQTRSAYRFSAEITIYIDVGCRRAGGGRPAYDHVFPLPGTRGIPPVIACIALPNEPSVALHEGYGLAKVAHFREVGFKLDRWIDIGYWQRILAAGA